jgi:predicted transcriptional regulator
MRYTIKTYELMKYIYDEMPHNMSEIARGLYRHRAAVSRSMHRLMDLGLVTQTESGMFVITHEGALKMVVMTEEFEARVWAAQSEIDKIEAVWEG